MLPVPSLISFKANGLLLPSLPEIVPVKLKDPSVESLFTVLVAPADTVALNGSLPDKTHDIAKLFVNINRLPLLDLQHLHF